MKPTLRQVTATPSSSFLVRKDKGSYMVNNWHYHPEIEILYIKKSSGTWLIGDHIGHFQSGDIVMIGANLPHCFRHEPLFIKDGITAGETICVKFEPDILGKALLQLPEAYHLRSAIGGCGCGLKLQGNLRTKVAAYIDRMQEATPGKRLVLLLSILEEIGAQKQHLPLSSKGFMQMKDDADRQRIKLVFDYTFNRYSDKITIDEVAGMLHLTRQSFCRYFKSRTNKTYIRFLMEVRIGAACRMLVEDERNVSEISYACGYNNISHFNHQFKYITGKNPMEYKRDYLDNKVLKLAEQT